MCCILDEMTLEDLCAMTQLSSETVIKRMAYWASQGVVSQTSDNVYLSSGTAPTINKCKMYYLLLYSSSAIISHGLFIKASQINNMYKDEDDQKSLRNGSQPS
jgi:hypothetical protein